MKHTVELIDELFIKFINDKQLLSILGVEKNDIEGCNRKIKRIIEDSDLVNDELDIFFTYNFIQSIAYTPVYLVNKNLLEFRLYGHSRPSINKLYIRLKEILKENYEEISVISEGSVSTGVNGLIGYMFRVRPFTWS